jgi:hypothetical protein
MQLHVPHTVVGTRRFVARALLGGILALTAVAAIASGLYGSMGANRVPPTWLVGSPFDSYLVPSIVLLVGVGGALSAAAIAVFARSKAAAALSLSAGLVLLGWVFAEVIVIGYVSWLQIAMAIVAKTVVVLALLEWPHLGPRLHLTT